jgi:hypothetical protein
MASTSSTISGSSRRRRARQQQQKARQRRTIALAAGAILLALALLVALRVLTSSQPAASDAPLSNEAAAALASVPAATFEAVVQGSAQVLPTPIRADVRRGPNGLPLVTYVGAEYCPYCAAQRWALALALSRFGQFSGVQTSHSAADDIYPNTPTLSFVDSSYTSPYLEFSSVELQSNQRSGGSYAPLQTPTPEQQQVLKQYDGPPYVPAGQAGSIPFVDIADQYMIAGSSYDVGVLRGQTVDSIAQSLSDPTSPTAQAIVGSANTITAALCSSTGGNPAEVCSQPAIQALMTTLANTPVPGGS